MDARRLFVAVARAEGISLLFLFFLAMPMKYGLGYEHATIVPGWIHGMLFMAYLVLLTWLSASERWSVLTSIMGLLASFLPFGTFWFETRLPERPASA